MAEIKVWLACGKDGQTRVYNSKSIPIWGGLQESGGWRGDKNITATIALSHLEQLGFQLPLLTYADDPVEITISLNYESPKTK